MSNAPAIPYATTIHVKDTCLCLHAQRAARALARRFDTALKPAGLTNQQFSLMMALNRPEPPPMGPVARLLAMDRTTLTAALKPLSARGWVSIEPDPKDKRGKTTAPDSRRRQRSGRRRPDLDATSRHHRGRHGKRPADVAPGAHGSQRLIPSVVDGSRQDWLDRSFRPREIRRAMLSPRPWTLTTPEGAGSRAASPRLPPQVKTAAQSYPPRPPDALQLHRTVMQIFASN